MKMPTITLWVLVARRNVATILSSAGRGEPLLTVRRIDHPRGRLKSGELDSDRPGRSFDRAAQGRHSMSTEESATERVAHEWALELARVIEQGRNENAFSQLALIAPPKLLGMLRGALSVPAQRMVIAELAKDLINPSEDVVRRNLADSIAF
jgi:protein required for attachment to host cells